MNPVTRFPSLNPTIKVSWLFICFDFLPVKMDVILHITGLKYEFTILERLNLTSKLVAIFHDNDVIFSFSDEEQVQSSTNASGATDLSTIKTCAP